MGRVVGLVAAASLAGLVGTETWVVIGGKAAPPPFVAWALAMSFLALIGVMLTIVLVSESLERRRAGRERRLEAQWFASVRERSSAYSQVEVRVADAAARAAFAKVALLEARLAAEQEELDEALRLIAEDELEALELAGVPEVGLRGTPDEDEQAIRETLIAALADAVGRGEQIAV